MTSKIGAHQRERVCLRSSARRISCFYHILLKVMLMLVFVVFLLLFRCEAEPNCVGVYSCRPRCLSFRFDRIRAPSQCTSNRGTFLKRDGAWNQDRSQIFACDDMNPWTGKILLDLKMGGDGWESFFQHILSASESAFTFCAPFMCPKTECSIPYQIGSFIEIHAIDQNENQLLDLSLVPTKTFNGTAFEKGRLNRFGPLILEFMDDPQGCRPDLFPYDSLPSPPIELQKQTPLRPELLCPNVQDLPLVPVAHETILWQIRFHHISRLLNNSEVQSFEEASRQYLRLNSIVLESFSVERQSLSRDHTLKVLVSVQAVNSDAAIVLFESDWENYVKALSRTNDIFRVRVDVTQNERSRDWTASLVALGLASVALAVTIWTRSRTKSPAVFVEVESVNPNNVEDVDDSQSIESDSGWQSDEEDSLRDLVVVDLVPTRPIKGTLVHI